MFFELDVRMAAQWCNFFVNRYHNLFRRFLTGHFNVRRVRVTSVLWLQW